MDLNDVFLIFIFYKTQVYHKMEISTLRIQIRPILPEDKEALFAYRSDPLVNKYQGWVPDSLADTKAFIDKNPKIFNEEGSWFQVVLIKTETGQIVGDVGIHFVGDSQVELGCTLKKEAQGLGYAREALTGIAKALFEVYSKHRIYVSIDPDNHKAIRLVEQLGFKKEAHHKKSYFFKGEWVDDVIYAVLREEWDG